MQLTKKQSEGFVNRYKQRYGDIKDIPVAKDEATEIKEWKEYIHNMLGSKSSSTYKYRSRGRQTLEDKVFGSLWLNYGPSFKK